MKRVIAIIGPESTGKSVLSQHIANQWSAELVPEYARTYLQMLDRPYSYEDLLDIATGQYSLETQAIQSHDKVVLDTNLEVIKIWSEYKYNKCHPWILERLAVTTYDAYLLTNIDLPWQDDPLREHPDIQDRQQLFDMYYDIVSQSNIPFHVVSGQDQSRMDNAIRFLQEINLW